MRSRSVGGIARKRKEVTSTSEVISANSGDSAAAAAAARRPPLPVIADTKAKKGRKEVTFGSEARDRGQQRRERSLNEPPPPPASERGNARERRRAEREDVKKAASTTSKVRDECGDGASSEAAVDVDGESVPGANSGEDH